MGLIGQVGGNTGGGRALARRGRCLPGILLLVYLLASASTFAELPKELQAAVPVGGERARLDPAQYVGRANEPNRAMAGNPVQQLELRFGASEVGVTSVAAEQSRWAMGLRLARYGRAGQLTPVADAPPMITGNRVEYRRGALVEWYVNEDRGVEQGFVIAARPAGPRGALELEMDVTGLRPELVDSGRVALRVPQGEQVLTYGELRVTDARGRELPAHLEVAKASGDRASVRLLVDDAAAAYPVTVDPLIVSQQAELTCSDCGDFGSTAALSSDGNTALIAAGNWAGYVFVRSGPTWTQQAEWLTSDGGAGRDGFGSSAPLSSDGNTALIGAYRKNGTGVEYVFVRSGPTWTQQAELTAGDGAGGDGFGFSAALSSDGNTALIGASPKTVSGNLYQGAAYVFVRSGPMWTQQAELTAGDGASGDSFGASAALSSDGNTALIGARDTGSHVGSAYVFVRSGTTWTQQAELTASDPASWDCFGSSAALNGDGNTALIAAGGISGKEAAYVFVRSGTTWTQQAELTTGGSSAALSSDGNTALIAAWNKAAYVFTRGGTTWTQQAKMTARDEGSGGIDLRPPDDSGFGYDAALSSDGKTALIGAIWAGSRIQGATYVYLLSFPLPQGAPCSSNGDCASGFCVDNVCCASACGGGLTTDCQACSVAAGAAVDGTCTVLTGMTCDDGNLCTQIDQCNGAGQCVGSNPVVCPAPDQCHAAGACEPSSGSCSNPLAPNGTTCDAGHACGQPDACQAGACIATRCVTTPVESGGTVTTDTGGTGATPADPVQTSVTSPVAGTVSITITVPTSAPPAGFTLVGEQVTIIAPDATPAAPLVLVFVIDASQIPAGADPSTIQIFKDDVLVEECAGPAGVASPDPCVLAQLLLPGGDIQITVLTSSASVWTFAVAAVCGNGTVESGEECDDGNLIDGDGCNADCTWTGLLPEMDDTPPASGKSDSASLTCMKTVGAQVRTYSSAVYDRLRACVGAMQEYNARVAAGLPAAQIAAALATARKQCVESSATVPDTKTPLGKLETARVTAISAIEKKCGTPGQTALDGKPIGNTASGDFTPAEITEHIGWARCQAEELFGRGYATATADLHTFTARDSQGGQALDTYFPCLSAADLPAMNYTPSAPGKKDSASVACQKAVGTRIGGYGSIQGYARTRHLLLRNCLDALLAHEAAVTAGAPAKQVQSLLSTARKQCVEPSATAADSKTLLGKLETARVAAVAAIEKKCGTPGQTALDGKLIGTGASSDLTEAQISTHAETAACRVDDVVSRGYNGAADLLATMTARPSQGGAPLDTYFACLLP